MTHPGTVTFVDAAAKTEKTLELSQVPEAVAWALVDGEKLPVVRVVALTQGDRRELHSYGVDGRLLTTTLQTAR